MLDLLQRLAKLDPELCRIAPMDRYGIALCTIGGVEFMNYPDNSFLVHLPGVTLQGELALDLLQGKLQRAIERRGWEYEQKYLGRQYEVVIFSRDPVQVTGMDIAAGALLAAYVKAMEAIR